MRDTEREQSNIKFFSRQSSFLNPYFFGFQMYGIDAASGAAVSALGISPGDHVLDLCAAPGTVTIHLSVSLVDILFWHRSCQFILVTSFKGIHYSQVLNYV